MKKFLLLTSYFLLLASSAEGRIYIPVDQPSDKRFPIAITDLVYLEKFRDIDKWAAQIPEIVKNDLLLSGYFEVIPKSSYLDTSDAITADAINFAKWTAIEAGAVVKGGIKRESGKYIVQLRLFDPYSGEMLVGKQYTTKADEMRQVAHRFSDEIMEALTGTRGVFTTKIAYSAVTGKGNKAIYMMDIDGENNVRITGNNSLDIGPAFSPDGSKIAYASYLHGGNPQIFVTDIATGKTRQVTSGNMSITPSWTPDGKTIAYSASLGFATELFFVPSNGGTPRQVTNNSGITIAPTWSPDGKWIVYSSTAPGRLHVYRQNIDGSGQRRLTFVGTHNDSPDISPDGIKIVFCGQDEGAFDIFIMDSDGSNIQRLTINSGSNEHPRWSPDGRFIVFSSSRTGSPAIYMMRRDGSNQVRISKGNGSLPDWGPRI